ncbi:MAG: alanine--glyoxylate aminotransferase family protein [Gemmatimonadetes bacterium]|nr:alanine--glyoxylate aminotransferase family protein [Gemmatimonadota bacterium]
MRVSDIQPVLLLGPGPSPVRERILTAMAHDTVGHLDPQFLTIMDEVNEGLRVLFGTLNRMTFPVSATGSAGMQASLVNLLEPGDTAIIGVNGVFGGRLAEMARRIGCEVVTVEAEWGRIIPPDDVIAAHKAHPDARVVALVHAETSTGVRQPLDEVGAALRDSATHFVVDAVTSLGGIPVDVDDNAIDVCYSGTHKCLGVPPGAGAHHLFREGDGPHRGPHDPSTKLVSGRIAYRGLPRRGEALPPHGADQLGVCPPRRSRDHRGGGSGRLLPPTQRRWHLAPECDGGEGVQPVRAGRPPATSAHVGRAAGR